MVRLMSIALGLAVLSMALAADTAWAAKGGKGKGKKGGETAPAGYSRVDSVDVTAKTFRLVADPKTYKFDDSTINKEKIYAGALIKVTLKEGSQDQVSLVDVATSGGKAKGKKKK